MREKDVAQDYSDMSDQINKTFVIDEDNIDNNNITIGNDDENKIKSDTRRLSLSLEDEAKADHSELSLMTNFSIRELSFIQHVTDNENLQSTMTTLNTVEEKSPHGSFVNQENNSISFVDDQSTKSSITSHQSASKDRPISMQLKQLPTYQKIKSTALQRQPSFAKNFPIRSHPKATSSQENHQFDISSTLSDEQVLSTSSDISVGILESHKFQKIPAVEKINSGEMLSTTGFDLFDDSFSQKSHPTLSTTIALREFMEDDLKMNNDLDIFVRVSKPDFDKIYVVRKLEGDESLQDFCKSDISKRSKLFKLKNSQSNEEIQVRKLPLDKLKNLCGVEHKSDILEFELLPHIAKETFTIQRLNQVSRDVSFSQFQAMDINVVRSSTSTSKFKVLKK